MTPKIIVYFEQFGKVDFKIFRNLKDACLFSQNTSLWPIFIDMAFQPLIVNQVEKDLTTLPKIPFVSISIKEAEPPSDLSLIEKFTCKINSRIAYPISRLVEFDVLKDGDTRLDSLPLATKHLTNDVNAAEENSFLYRQLEDFHFTVRSKNVFISENIKYVGELLGYTEAQLLRLKNMGRKSVLEIKDFLRDNDLALPRVDTDKKPFDSENKKNSPITDNSKKLNFDTGFCEQIEDALNLLDNRSRDIIRRRSGLRDKEHTLEMCGRVYKVSRERIRQIEAKTLKKLKHASFSLPWEEFETQLHKVFNKGILPITLENLGASHSLFHHSEKHKKLLVYLITNAVKQKYFISKFEDWEYLSRFHPDSIGEYTNNIENVLSNCEGKTKDECFSLAKQVLPANASEFSSILTERALKHCIWQESDGAKVLRIFSNQSSAVNVALSIILDSEFPVSNSQIEKLLQEKYPTYELRNVINRLQDAPGIFPFSHGTWGSINHIGLTDAEMQSFKIYIRDFLRQIERDQFHGAEVYNYISQFDPILRKKLTDFNVSGLIRHFGSAVYLGRNMFSKTGSNTERLQLHDLVVKALRESECPLKTKDIRKIIEKQRYVKKNFQVLPNDPIQRIGNGFFGLTDWNAKIANGTLSFTIPGENTQFLKFN